MTSGRATSLPGLMVLFYNSLMSSITVTSSAGQPAGRFGGYGGRYVPESLIPACQAVADAFAQAWADPGFRGSLARLLSPYAARPTPLTPALRLSAELGVPVTTGSRTLKDATSAAMRHWVGDADEAYFCVGSVIGPHPYPTMVREFQRVIGDEARRQCAAELAAAVPDYVVACVGGGSNALGTFAGFVDTAARIVGVEAEGGSGASNGEIGVLHGFQSLFLQDAHGQIKEAHPISAGPDHPGVGPAHP